jgi:hypothetical protein
LTFTARRRTIQGSRDFGLPKPPVEDRDMAVVGINEIKGDPKELLAKYDKVNAKLMERATPSAGLLVHTCIELPDGIRIANVWESKQHALDAFKDEGFQSALRGAGFDANEPTILAVHNHINFAAMQGAVP